MDGTVDPTVLVTLEPAPVWPAIFAAVFAALYAAHQVGDHLIQTDRAADGKDRPGWAGVCAMAAHVGSYHVACLVALVALGPLGVALHPLAVLAGLGFSAATHWFIDLRWPVQWLLCRTGSPRFARLNRGGINGCYLADQALHVGCLFVSAWLITAITAAASPGVG
jgi:hypothetical protein